MTVVFVSLPSEPSSSGQGLRCFGAAGSLVVLLIPLAHPKLENVQ